MSVLVPWRLAKTPLLCEGKEYCRQFRVSRDNRFHIVTTFTWTFFSVECVSTKGIIFENWNRILPLEVSKQKK